MRTTKALAGVALALTALLTVTACGSAGTGGAGMDGAGTEAAGNGVADMSAEEILTASQDAALAQSSVHMTGTITQGSDKLTMDLSLEKAGGATGTLEIAGATLEIVATGTTVYLRGDTAFWESQAGAGAAEIIGDKWVAATTDADIAQFKDLTDFTSALGGILDPSGTVTKGGTSTVDGVAVIGLKDGEKGTLWVATTGEPLPVAIDGGSEGKVSFTDWGAKVTITEPAAADVLDPAQIGQ